MEANPYAAPATVVEDAGACAGGDLEARKSSRSRWLGAALLERFSNLLWIAPLAWAVMWDSGGKHALNRPELTIGLYIVGGFLTMIPLAGRLAGLVDVLLIFGNERRCLHDLIADTIVLDV